MRINGPFGPPRLDRLEGLIPEGISPSPHRPMGIRRGRMGGNVCNLMVKYLSSE